MMHSRTNTEVWDSLVLDLVSIQVEGKIVYINAAGAKMLGALTSEELVGKPILDFVHPDYHEIAVERVRQATTEGFVVCPSDEMWLRLDGTAFQVEVAAMPVIYHGKPAMQVIAKAATVCKPFRPARDWRALSKSKRRRY